MKKTLLRLTLILCMLLLLLPQTTFATNAREIGIYLNSACNNEAVSGTEYVYGKNPQYFTKIYDANGNEVDGTVIWTESTNMISFQKSSHTGGTTAIPSAPGEYTITATVEGTNISKSIVVRFVQQYKLNFSLDLERASISRESSGSDFVHFFKPGNTLSLNIFADDGDYFPDDTPPTVTATPGIEYTLEKVTDRHYICTISDATADGTVTITAAATNRPYPETPQVFISETELTCTEGDTASSIPVIAIKHDGGVLSYQWFSAPGAEDGEFTPIEGAVGTNFRPPTDTVGETRYFCRVTNTMSTTSGGSDSRSADSQVVTVTVLPSTKQNALTADQKLITGTITAGDHAISLPALPAGAWYVTGSEIILSENAWGVIRDYSISTGNGLHFAVENPEAGEVYTVTIPYNGGDTYKNGSVILVLTGIADQAAPAAPTIRVITDTHVKFDVNSTQEYAVTTTADASAIGYWWSEPKTSVKNWDGLQPGTDYWLWTRTKGDGAYLNPSPAVSTKFTTMKTVVLDGLEPIWLQKNADLTQASVIAAIKARVVSQNPGYDGTLTINSTKDASGSVVSILSALPTGVYTVSFSCGSDSTHGYYANNGTITLNVIELVRISGITSIAANGSVTVEVQSGIAATLMVARYEVGKMTDIKSITVSSASTTYTLTMGGTGDEVRAFLLDGSYTPLCASRSNNDHT